MASKKIDTKITKQLRIDSGVHTILKTEASKVEKSIKEYVEEVLAEYWGKEGVCF